MSSPSLSLKIKWLESTLEFTREKIGVEEVLGHLLRDLAETTIANRIEEQKLHRLVVKSSSLLQLLREELRASRVALKKLKAMNNFLMKADQ